MKLVNFACTLALLGGVTLTAGAASAAPMSNDTMQTQGGMRAGQGSMSQQRMMQGRSMQSRSMQRRMMKKRMMKKRMNRM